MRTDPLRDPAGDGQEPDGSLPPAGNDDGTSAEPGQQGLYLCLPVGSCDADRFAQSGPATDMAPDPLLVTVIETIAGEDGQGLAGLSDDQLIGVIAAVRRLESRVAWYAMAAVGEFTARNTGPDSVEEFAADQLAFQLHLTQPSATAQMDYAATVTTRLPATFAALRAGRVHPVHVRIIEDETRVLSAKGAARADAELAAVAGSLTFGRLRAAAHRLVLKLDAEAAKKRKDAAGRDAHVRRFREDSGNAGMVARELPPDEVLASWQHVEQRALDLRAADVPGTLQELRVRAYLDLLQERDSRPTPDGAATDAAADPDDTGEADGPRDWIGRLRIQMTPIARGGCGHIHAEPGYRPSRALQHLVKVRNGRCTAPGCGRPAARCDLDHTTAWDQGGLTCECDLAPLCRHHRRCKQAQGWRLEQPEPGVLVWRTPAGRSYATGPTAYPA
jgi:Domain of unknown function (DUF222)